MARTNPELKDSVVVCHNSQDVEVRANLLRLTRYQAVFETYSPTVILRSSEVLTNFKIIINDRAAYAGRAVVSNLITTGTGVVCEAKLDESGLSLGFLAGAQSNGSFPTRFREFLEVWQKFYRIDPEFKTVMADLQSFLTDLRLWLEQVELDIHSSPSADRAELERKAVDELGPPAIRAIDSFIERFEAIATRLDPDEEPAHRMYLRRQLHPLVLCSPFAYRTYHKPLGYAGDYEVVAMMLRSPHEGRTLFAKIINVWLHGQAPAQAHRNRVTYLTRKLVEETTRVAARSGSARIFNLGCGPADEVLRFLREEESICEKARFTLLDFNEETLEHLRVRLAELKSRHDRGTPVQLIKKSVHQILKEGGRSVPRAADNQFDLVYCAGLFDYLSNQVCKRLMNIFYDLVAPGGLLLATNVSDALNSSRPFRYSMEYILDWHLIYRNGDEFVRLAPDAAPAESIKIIAEDTGVNVFMEVRKPGHA